MHSFRLYLINAIYILTFPYRIVNIYFCVFSDFFRFRRFFIDISSKALKPPAAKRFAENRIAPPAKPRADSRSAFPQNRAHGVAFAPRRTAGRRTDTRESVTAANRRSPPLRRIVGPQYAFALRPAPVRKPPVHQRTAAPHGASNRHTEKTAQSNAEVIWGNARAYAACPFGIP